MRITFAGAAPRDVRLARAAVREALARAALPRDAGIGVTFVDAPTIRGLNARHRGIDRATDVLSFGQALPRGVRGAEAATRLERTVDGSLEVGDIVIAGEVAARQARRRGWTVAREVAFLVAHGALHLVGYDDDTPAGYREMRRLGTEAVDRARRRIRRTRETRRPPNVYQRG